MDDWNGEGPQSPKKKLHSKGSMKEKVNNVRRDLKNARDISARNLLAHMNGGEQASCSGGSTSEEEVYVIDEETTDFTEGEEYEVVEEEYEEVVVSDSENSDLEPLPPPISIPKELQVKDSDDEESEVDSSDSDDEDSEDEEEEEVAPLPTRPKKVLDHDNMRPTSLRGPSCYDEDPTAATSQPNQESVALTEKDNEEEEAVPQPPLRPSTLRGHSLCVHDSSTTAPRPKVATAPAPAPEPSYASSRDDNSDACAIGWKKPDWTKNTKLRATGKSAAGNLAKPITNLPHMKKSYGDNDHKPAATVPRSPPTATKNSVATPKTPTRHGKDPSTFKTPTKSNKTSLANVAPKSAPTVQKASPALSASVSGGADDSCVPNIGWEKPDWAKKPVLRTTSKGGKLKSGVDISRPIGGIKPVD